MKEIKRFIIEESGDAVVLYEHINWNDNERPNIELFDKEGKRKWILNKVPIQYWLHGINRSNDVYSEIILENTRVIKAWSTNGFWDEIELTSGNIVGTIYTK